MILLLTSMCGTIASLVVLILFSCELSRIVHQNEKLQPIIIAVLALSAIFVVCSTSTMAALLHIMFRMYTQ